MKQYFLKICLMLAVLTPVLSYAASPRETVNYIFERQIKQYSARGIEVKVKDEGKISGLQGFHLITVTLKKDKQQKIIPFASNGDIVITGAVQVEGKNHYPLLFAALAEKNRVSVSVKNAVTVHRAENSKFNIVMYLDFECPYCKIGKAQVLNLVKEKKLPANVYIKPVLIHSNEKNRFLTGMFIAVSHFKRDISPLLFSIAGKNKEEIVKRIKDWCKKNKIDYVKAVKIAQSKKTRDIIEANEREMLETLHSNGTPTFVVDSYVVRGASFGLLRHFVEKAERQKGA
ncbi:MAG: thioredoxin domain-containing protein [Deltaproteobacteria bacterium]|nr:thioredoxin domain-containing protein [Deltaproteobacteria bacterium]